MTLDDMHLESMYMAAAETLTATDTDTLQKLVLDLARAEKRTLELKADLDQAEKDFKFMKFNVVPNAFREAHLEGFTTNNIEFKLRDKEVFSPKDETQSNSWLINNGLSSILKSTIEVPYADGDKLLSALSDIGVSSSYKLKVHHMTLNKALKEEEEAGRTVPENVFNRIDLSHIVIKERK